MIVDLRFVMRIVPAYLKAATNIRRYASYRLMVAVLSRTATRAGINPMTKTREQEETDP